MADPNVTADQNFDALLADVKAKEAALGASKTAQDASAAALAHAQQDDAARMSEKNAAHASFEASVETMRQALEDFKVSQ